MLPHDQDVTWSVRGDRGRKTQKQEKLLLVGQIRAGSVEEGASQRGWKGGPSGGTSREQRHATGPREGYSKDREPIWPG